MNFEAEEMKFYKFETSWTQDNNAMAISKKSVQKSYKWRIAMFEMWNL
jgi:hypothetical protein